MYDRDMVFLQQLMGNRGHWPLILIIGGIFLVVALKRESIVHLGLFRLGVVLVACSMVISPILNALRMEMPIGGPMQPAGNSNLFLNSIEPVLLSGALICIVFSMLPSSSKAHSASQKPAIMKHPLDD